MRFSLIKAIKSTHRHPLNKILHTIGLSLYFISILLIASNFFIQTNVNYFIIALLFGVAISLFIFGHKIEGNLGATTWVVLFKYLQSYLKNKKKKNLHLG
jgi:uncharacterized membrane protein YGL010W